MSQAEMRNRHRISELEAELNQQIGAYKDVRRRLTTSEHYTSKLSKERDAFEYRLDDAKEYLKLVIQGGGGTSVEHEMEKLCEALDVDWVWESAMAKDREV